MAIIYFFKADLLFSEDHYLLTEVLFNRHRKQGRIISILIGVSWGQTGWRHPGFHCTKFFAVLDCSRFFKEFLYFYVYQKVNFLDIAECRKLLFQRAEVPFIKKGTFFLEKQLVTLDLTQSVKPLITHPLWSSITELNQSKKFLFLFVLIFIPDKSQWADLFMRRSARMFGRGQRVQCKKAKVPFF